MALPRGMSLAAVACVVAYVRLADAGTTTTVVPAFTTDRSSFNSTGEHHRITDAKTETHTETESTRASIRAHIDPHP